MFRHINTSSSFTSSILDNSEFLYPFVIFWQRLIQQMVGAQMIKISYISPKAQQAAELGREEGECEGGEENESNER